MIRQCGSQWCLYTRDGDRLLGRHDTKEQAVKQEQAIKIQQARAAIITTLDEVAEQLDRRGAVAWAMVVDTASELLTQRREQLDDAGFDEVMRRDPDVAQEVADDKISPINPYSPAPTMSR